MALVDHHQRVVPLGQRADPVERRGIAVHREDAVRYDDAEALRLRLFEALLQLVHVGVGVAVAHGLAQTHAVDDRSVVQRVGDDGVLLREEGLEHAAVRVEAGGVEDRILRAEIVGDGLFELLVDILTTADETHGRHAVSARVHRPFGSLYEARIVRKSEVVVRAEVQHFASADLDLGPLGRLDDPLVLVKPGRFDFGEFVL